MSNFTQAFYEVLIGDSTLAGMLSEYGDHPSIFTAIPIPDNAELPYIITEGEIGNSPFDTKSFRGREVIRDIRCYGSASGSSKNIEAIAERVRTLFHRQAISITNYEDSFLTEASNILTVNEDGVYGRIVTIRILVMEE